MELVGQKSGTRHDFLHCGTVRFFKIFSIFIKVYSTYKKLHLFKVYNWCFGICIPSVPLQTLHPSREEHLGDWRSVATHECLLIHHCITVYFFEEYFYACIWVYMKLKVPKLWGMNLNKKFEWRFYKPNHTTFGVGIVTQRKTLIEYHSKFNQQ